MTVTDFRLPEGDPGRHVAVAFSTSEVNEIYKSTIPKGVVFYRDSDQQIPMVIEMATPFMLADSSERKISIRCEDIPDIHLLSRLGGVAASRDILH
jgi:hypothetical protein